jgi:hypothetical protein
MISRLAAPTPHEYFTATLRTIENHLNQSLLQVTLPSGKKGVAGYGRY